MTFYSLNRTTSPLPVHLGDGTPIGSILDVLQYEPRGLAIDAISGKVLIRDIENRSLDRFVDINPADPAESVFTYSGSQKFITRENGNMELTAVGEIPLDHKYNVATGLYEPNGILIEPQKTNLMLRNTETLGWSEMTTTGLHATLRYIQNNIADFKGRMVAKKLIASTTTDLQRIYKSTTGINSGATEKICYQCFLKAGEYSKVILQNSESEGVSFDLLDGSAQPFQNTIDQNNSFGTINQGDGWWFAWVVFDHPNTDTGNVPWIQILDDAGASTFAGNGTDGIYFYGDQVTVGDHPTSLIETDSSTVMRLADYPLAIDTSKFPYDPTKGTFIVEYADTDAQYSGILSSPNKSFLFRNVDPDQVATHTGTGGNNAVSSPRQTSGFQKAGIAWGPTGSQLAHRGVSGPRQINANDWGGISQITLGSRFTVVHAAVQIKSLTYVPIDRTQAQIESLTND